MVAQHPSGADLGFLKGGLFFGKALVLEARGPGHRLPRFFEEGPTGGHHVMKKINVLRPRDENAMLSGSDGQNYQSGGST